MIGAPMPYIAAAVLLAAVNALPVAQTGPAYLNPALSDEARAKDLVSRLTLDEKIAQLQRHAPAISRLNIPAYDWWSEALHGIARNGYATVYPQAIGLAATWDPALLHTEAETVALEARAKYEKALSKNGATSQDEGITLFSPNVNIFRDPRWGRGQETYGEDPYLTAQMGIAFVSGLQGDDPPYLRTVATVKHFAAHSGPEAGRSAFDARVSPYDLTDTYLSQFEQIVRKAHPGSIMTAYSAINGVPVSADKPLLDMVRDQWGFTGYFVSDCDAIDNIYDPHHYAKSLEEAAADALKAGVDLNCGHTYRELAGAVKDGLVSESDIDTSLTRLFLARIRLGMFDPQSRVPYANVPQSQVDSPAHRALALKAAQESLVLLRNAGNLLPLKKQHVGTLAVIGPTADNQDVLIGNYNGDPSRPVTILDGILARAHAEGIPVTFAPGGFFAEAQSGPYTAQTDDGYVSQAVATAKHADVIVLVTGLDPNMEGEEGVGDRSSIDLPPSQERLVRDIAALKKPTALVLTGGSALAIPWESAHIPAIMYAWYPGEAGGTAVAQALFGDTNPAGRLPITMYRSTSQLPPFTSYSMRGRTYRYFTGDPLYPFGFGLSYTKFHYTNLRVAERNPQTGTPLHASIDVRNVGARAGDDVVELYVSFSATPFPAPHPLRSLAGFQRIALRPNETKTVEFTLDARALSAGCSRIGAAVTRRLRKG